jgi:cytochrome oxidase Cu insertion factor (SCO1/SenC/PrrC family)
LNFHLKTLFKLQANEQLDDEEDYLVDHSIVLYLVDKEGQFVDFFTQRALIGDVVEKIEGHMKAYEANALATATAAAAK